MSRNELLSPGRAVSQFASPNRVSSFSRLSSTLTVAARAKLRHVNPETADSSEQLDSIRSPQRSLGALVASIVDRASLSQSLLGSNIENIPDSPSSSGMISSISSSSLNLTMDMNLSFDAAVKSLSTIISDDLPVHEICAPPAFVRVLQEAQQQQSSAGIVSLCMFALSQPPPKRLLHQLILITHWLHGNVSDPSTDDTVQMFRGLPYELLWEVAKRLTIERHDPTLLVYRRSVPTSELIHIPTGLRRRQLPPSLQSDGASVCMGLSRLCSNIRIDEMSHATHGFWQYVSNRFLHLCDQSSGSASITTTASSNSSLSLVTLCNWKNAIPVPEEFDESEPASPVSLAIPNTNSFTSPTNRGRKPQRFMATAKSKRLGAGSSGSFNGDVLTTDDEFNVDRLLIVTSGRSKSIHFCQSTHFSHTLCLSAASPPLVTHKVPPLVQSHLLHLSHFLLFIYLCRTHTRLVFDRVRSLRIYLQLSQLLTLRFRNCRLEPHLVMQETHYPRFLLVLEQQNIPCKTSSQIKSRNYSDGSVCGAFSNRPSWLAI